MIRSKNKEFNEFENCVLKNKDINHKVIEEIFYFYMNDKERKIFKFNRSLKEQTFLIITSLVNILFLRKVKLNKASNITRTTQETFKSFLILNLVGFYFGFITWYYSKKTINKLYYNISKGNYAKQINSKLFQTQLEIKYKYSHGVILLIKTSVETFLKITKL